MRLNAMHTVFSLWNSEEQLYQASSGDIQLCEEKKQNSALSFDMTTISSITKDKNCVPASDAQEVTDIL